MEKQAVTNSYIMFSQCNEWPFCENLLSDLVLPLEWKCDALVLDLGFSGLGLESDAPELAAAWVLLVAWRAAEKKEEHKKKVLCCIK